MSARDPLLPLVLGIMLVLLFLMAGFELTLDALVSAGSLALVYAGARTAGKLGGAALGATLASAPPVVRQNLGLCLMPQAGVTLGLSLAAAARFPEVGEQLLSIVLATTLLFELVGPVAARVGLGRAGELTPIPKANP